MIGIYKQVNKIKYFKNKNMDIQFIINVVFQINGENLYNIKYKIKISNFIILHKKQIF